jgi:hypothetical protein
MNILPVDRALSIYGALADRAETKGARERLSRHLMKMVIEGETDEHHRRCTGCLTCATSTGKSTREART